MSDLFIFACWIAAYNLFSALHCATHGGHYALALALLKKVRVLACSVVPSADYV
jgi:hypothetical protein